VVRARVTPFAVLAALALSLTAAGCANNDVAAAPSLGAVFTKTDLVFGSGTEAASTSTVTVSYTGWFFDPAKAAYKGVQFDTSEGRGPITFVLGSQQVIDGWEQGLPGMRVGGTRRLIIPPSMAYGPSRQGLIPPNTPLVFEVQLLNVE
jgi:FKBP-type peptidyl-prolyl cis-trans isomerase FkpA